MKEVRPGEKQVDVAGQGAVALQGSLKAALDHRPALGVNQGVGSLDPCGNLGRGDVDGHGEQQQNEQADHDPAHF